MQLGEQVRTSDDSEIVVEESDFVAVEIAGKTLSRVVYPKIFSQKKQSFSLHYIYQKRLFHGTCVLFQNFKCH